eukprot:695778-Pyramimonas_sp.AAC.1
MKGFLTFRTTVLIHAGGALFAGFGRLTAVDYAPAISKMMEVTTEISALDSNVESKHEWVALWCNIFQAAISGNVAEYLRSTLQDKQQKAAAAAAQAQAQQQGQLVVAQGSEGALHLGLSQGQNATADIVDASAVTSYTAFYNGAKGVSDALGTAAERDLTNDVSILTAQEMALFCEFLQYKMMEAALQGGLYADCGLDNITMDPWVPAKDVELTMAK